MHGGEGWMVFPVIIRRLKIFLTRQYLPFFHLMSVKTVLFERTKGIALTNLKRCFCRDQLLMNRIACGTMKWVSFVGAWIKYHTVYVVRRQGIINGIFMLLGDQHFRVNKRALFLSISLGKVSRISSNGRDVYQIKEKRDGFVFNNN